MIYIKINVDSKKSIGNPKSLLAKIFSFLFQEANPDFDEKISFVSKWLLEFENEDSIPSREIGLNEKGEIIVKMPYNENYGYWSDNNLKWDDFKKSFRTEFIEKDCFEKKWNELN